MYPQTSGPIDALLLTRQHQRLEPIPCDRPCGIICAGCKSACTASCSTCHDLTLSSSTHVQYVNGLITPPPDKLARVQHAAHKCGKVNAVCGHRCEDRCSAGHEHIGADLDEACKGGKVLEKLEDCTRVGVHEGLPCKSCPFKCGRAVWSRKLTELGARPCARRCEHVKCDLPCYVPCEVKACDEPCPRTMSCGHNCPSGASLLHLSSWHVSCL